MLSTLAPLVTGSVRERANNDTNIASRVALYPLLIRDGKEEGERLFRENAPTKRTAKSRLPILQNERGFKKVTEIPILRSFPENAEPPSFPS